MNPPDSREKALRFVKRSLIRAYEADLGQPLSPEMNALLELLGSPPAAAPASPLKRKRFLIF